MSIRRNRQNSPLQVSEAELVAMTSELDQLHHDVAVPALAETVAAFSEERDGGARRRTSRRTFLLGTGAAVGGGILLAACGSSSSSTSSSSAAAAGSGGGYPANLTGDLKVAAVAASLENLGIYAYKAGIAAAQAGKLGTVPPAVVTFAQTAMSQHQDHAAAWNAVLTGAGKKAVTETDPALTPTVNQMFAKVTDVPGLANLALTIENIAAETYQSAVGVLSSTKAIATAATIQPVEMQHAAILNFVLGKYPVPNAFSPIDQARTPADLG